MGVDRPTNYSRGYAILKRALDICMSVVVLLLISPLLLLLIAAVLVDMGWPPLFVQIRPGLYGKFFSILKIRTMTNRCGVDGRLLPDKSRLSRLGSFLRSSSLDELPELMNVILGDMSLVGPRPLLTEYLPLYNERQARRHEVRPGMTGLAQINGRNALTWEQKLELDVYYVDHASFWLDLKILGLTAWKVLKAEGIAAKGHATMPPFKGTSASGQ